MLVRWVLTRKGDMADWKQEARVELCGALGHYMNEYILDAFSSEPSNWCAIQVRFVSPDGRYVLISASVLRSLFVVEMVYEISEAVPSIEKMGRVFPLSDYWPRNP